MYRLVLIVILGLLPLTAAAKSIVVLGDSISAGYGIDAGAGWVSLLQQRFNQRHDGHVISNESISGDTSAGGLARIDQVLAKHKPELVLVELGANDGLRGLSPQQMRSNLSEIIGRCRQSGAKVLMLGMKIPPNYGKRFVDMFYNVYRELSTELNVPLVPFILEDIALNPDLMQPDGLHPNASAQPLIAEKIWPYIEVLL
ncbi:MAG: arylesterase [Methylomonas sp.]|nr:arylesterase [Methylomonas sp.]